jgi:hypothetical protein
MGGSSVYPFQGTYQLINVEIILPSRRLSMTIIHLHLEFDPLAELHKIERSCVLAIHPFTAFKEQFLSLARFYSLP